MRFEKNKYYRIQVLQHRIAELSGAVIIAKYNGEYFTLDWKGASIIIDSKKVTLLNQVNKNGSSIIEGGLFDGQNK
jgi:hypothetical protein